MLLSTSRLDLINGAASTAKYFGPRSDGIKGWYVNWYYHSCETRTTLFAMHRTKGDRPFIFVSMPDKLVYLDGWNPFVQVVNEAIKNQDTEIMAFSSYQGRGYW